MNVEQKLLMAVVLDFLRTAQKEARASKACCEAVLHLTKSVSVDEFEAELNAIKGEVK
jgi:hypothetical protein